MLTNVGRDLGVRTVWKYRKLHTLEQQLEEFVAYLSTVALAFKLKRKDDERRRLAAAEAERRRREEELQRWQEEQRRRERARHLEVLEAEVRDWRRAQDIRAYVAAATCALEGQPESDESRQRRTDLVSLLALADRVDPLLGEDPNGAPPVST